MRNMMMVFVILSLASCSQYKRLTNSETKHDNAQSPVHESFVVSCCMDNDATGNPTYPTFLPPEHVQLCKTARKACHDNGCNMNGDIYLPMGVDCGRTPYKIGDSYYSANGY